MCRNKRKQRKQNGIALVIVLIFVMIFSTIAIAMFTMSSQNVIAANNMHQASQARACAESGLETLRYYSDQVAIPGLTDVNQRYTEFIASLRTNLANKLSYVFDEDSQTLYVGSDDSPISLNSASNQSFCAQITPNGTNGVNVCITGNADGLGRTISGEFSYGVRETSVFDYGVASKGSVSAQKIVLDGVNVCIEADMYIESWSTTDALLLGNSQIAGDVKIVNPDGSVTMTGNSSIGGETGINAIVNHVEVGVPPTEFPTPNPSYFEQYVNGITIDSSNLGSYSSNSTLENVRIAAGTNPTFDGQTTINGVMYIEQPNVVTFAGSATITGLIVGDGSVDDNSGTNQIIFEGSVSSSSVESLPMTEQYAGLQDETGTFLMAPGFSVAMGGDFGSVNGCIAANGFTTYGSASGTIEGSVVNYSPDTMYLGGSNLYFNRSGVTEIPAGFVPEIVIHYDASAYAEVH